MERVPILQERLMVVRRRRGLSQDHVAQQARLFKTDVSKYERGVSVPTLARLIRLAMVLETSTDYLLGLSDQDVCMSAPAPSPAPSKVSAETRKAAVVQAQEPAPAPPPRTKRARKTAPVA